MGRTGRTERKGERHSGHSSLPANKCFPFVTANDDVIHKSIDDVPMQRVQQWCAVTKPKAKPIKITRPPPSNWRGIKFELASLCRSLSLSLCTFSGGGGLKKKGKNKEKGGIERDENKQTNKL